VNNPDPNLPPTGYSHTPAWDHAQNSVWNQATPTGQPPWARPPQPGYPAQPQYAPYQPPRPPKKHTARNIVLGVLGTLLVIIVASAVAAGGKTPSTGTTASSPGTSAPSSAHAAPAPAPATKAPMPSQVTFACTGSAPDGINITYGPEGTNDSAGSLPFTKTVPLDSGAPYYNVTAQLSGSGHVSCTTVVEWDGQSVTQSGSASGGYNIASAEMCSAFTGGWEKC
jgi:hypothetical protein